MQEEIIQTSATRHRRPFLDRRITTRELVFLLALLFCLSPIASPPLALLIGLLIAQFIGHPYIHLNHKATHILLQASVVLLGFSMNVHNAISAGKEGIAFTIVSIIVTMTIGILSGKILKTGQKTSYLIAAGTAICGGSAIAAISPVIRAEEKQISVALGTVFILNAVALFVFPAIGHLLHLSQMQFGLWSAIAIHDTSSVVGAAGKYGSAALEVATTVKLARALWIIPVAILSGVLFRNKKSRIKVPWFIGLFILAMLANTFIPVVHRNNHYLSVIAHTGLTVTLFLIGSGLSRQALQQVGIRPLLQGLIVWLLISAGALWAVMSFAG